jgi:hypothetical protein
MQNCLAFFFPTSTVRISGFFIFMAEVKKWGKKRMLE